MATVDDQRCASHVDLSVSTTSSARASSLRAWRTSHHRSDDAKILLLLPLPLPLLRYEQALTAEQGPYTCGSLLFCAAVVAIHHPLTAPPFLLKVSSTAASLVGWLQCRALPPPQLFSCSSFRSCCQFRPHTHLLAPATRRLSSPRAPCPSFPAAATPPLSMGCSAELVQ